MKIAAVIAREANLLSVHKQAEVLDFIAFLKAKQSHTEQVRVASTQDAIAAFFRSVNVDTRNFKFDRDEANT